MARLTLRCPPRTPRPRPRRPPRIFCRRGIVRRRRRLRSRRSGRGRGALLLALAAVTAISSGARALLCGVVLRVAQVHCVRIMTLTRCAARRSAVGAWLRLPQRFRRGLRSAVLAIQISIISTRSAGAHQCAKERSLRKAQNARGIPLVNSVAGPARARHAPSNALRRGLIISSAN